MLHLQCTWTNSKYLGNGIKWTMQSNSKMIDGALELKIVTYISKKDKLRLYVRVIKLRILAGAQLFALKHTSDFFSVFIFKLDSFKWVHSFSVKVLLQPSF